MIKRYFELLIFFTSFNLIAQTKTVQKKAIEPKKQEKSNTKTLETKQHQGVGEWWRTESDEYKKVLLLNPNGSGSLDNWEFSYKFYGNKLTVSDYDGVTMDFICVFEGNSITLTGGNFSQPEILFKAGSDESYRKLLVSKPEKLIAKWKNAKGDIEFKKDGKMSMAGNIYSYKANGSIITFTGSNGNKEVPYNIVGNNLTLEIDNKSEEFIKVNANEIEYPIGNISKKAKSVYKK